LFNPDWILILAIVANLVTAMTIYLLTTGNIKIGAYTGLGGQCMWLTYIYLTASWAFLPGDIFIFGMYCRKVHKHFELWCKERDKDYPQYLSGKIRSKDADI